MEIFVLYYMSVIELWWVKIVFENVITFQQFDMSRRLALGYIKNKNEM